MKLKHILENQILVPRRSKEERSKNLAVVHYKQIQEYIKNGSKGNLDLSGTPLKSLPPNLIRVEGSLHLDESQIESLGNLEYVERSFYLDESEVVSLGKLKHVGTNLSLMDCENLRSLGDLEYVGWNLDLENTPIEDLGKLKHVEDDLWLLGTPIARTHTNGQIRRQVNVGGEIVLYSNKTHPNTFM